MGSAAAPEPGRGPLRALPDPVRLAVGTLTVLRVPPPRRVDPSTAAAAMALAPLVGLGLGVCAAGVGAATWALGGSALLCAALALTVLAWLTRGMHLDGLADTADGLGCGRHGSDAVEIMRRSDVGAFGVATLVLALALQAASLAGVAASPDGLGRWHGGAAMAAAAVVGVTAGRVALPLATRRGWPAADSGGLGAAVAGSVPAGGGVAFVVAAVLSAAVASPGPLLGLLAAESLLRRTRSRFGGITGDVLGACVEVATTVTLVVLALPGLAFPWA